MHEEEEEEDILFIIIIIIIIIILHDIKVHIKSKVFYYYSVVFLILFLILREILEPLCVRVMRLRGTGKKARRYC